MLMQLDDLQCWDLAFVWAQLQFNQMQKYVDSNLYTIETSLAGQRWEPHVKGDATDSCHKICHCHLIFPVERRLQSSEYHLDMSLRTWDLLLGVGEFLLLVEGCSLCIEIILTQEERLQTPNLCHVYAATVNQRCFALSLLGGAT